MTKTRRKRKSRIVPLVFVWRPRDDGGWNLISPEGKVAATVFANGVWSVWDRNGWGGENDVEKTVAEAKRQALAAVFIAGHHGVSCRKEEP